MENILGPISLQEKWEQVKIQKFWIWLISASANSVFYVLCSAPGELATLKFASNLLNHWFGWDFPVLAFILATFKCTQCIQLKRPAALNSTHQLMLGELQSSVAYLNLVPSISLHDARAIDLETIDVIKDNMKIRQKYFINPLQIWGIIFNLLINSSPSYYLSLLYIIIQSVYLQLTRPTAISTPPGNFLRLGAIKLIEEPLFPCQSIRVKIQPQEVHGYLPRTVPAATFQLTDWKAVSGLDQAIHFLKERASS